MSINWEFVRNFKASEFPEDPNKFADPALLYALQIYRDKLGCNIYPSPITGALARFTGSKTSMHYAGQDKLSKGVDVFPDCDIKQAFLVAMRCQQFHGIGIYPYTKYKGKTWPMLHLDIRPLGKNELIKIWIRDAAGTYLYPDNKDDKAAFYEEFSKL